MHPLHFGRGPWSYALQQAHHLLPVDDEQCAAAYKGNYSFCEKAVVPVKLYTQFCKVKKNGTRH